MAMLGLAFGVTETYRTLGARGSVLLVGVSMIALGLWLLTLALRRPAPEK